MKLARFFLIVLILLILCSPSLATAVTRHYVHDGLTEGNNDGSSWANAWQDVQNINWSALQSEAASQPVYLYIKKGSIITTQMRVGGSGSSDTNRIFVTTDPADSGVNPSIEGINAEGRSYITFTNLTVENCADTGDGGLRFHGNSSYITISSCLVQNNARNGITHWSTNNYAQGVIIEDTTIQNNGSTTDINNGIFFKGHDIIIRRCTVTNNGYGDDQISYSHGIYVDDGTTRAEIYDNKVYSNPKGTGIQTKCNANIYRNLLYSNRNAGMNVSDNKANNITSNIFNNIIYNNYDHAINISGKGSGDMNVNIYNNSTYLNGTGGNNSSWFAEIFVGNNLTSFNLKNNIFYARSTCYTVSSESTVQSNMVANNNIHYGPSGNPIYYNGAKRTWSYWTTSLGQDAHGSNVDPKYVDPPANMTLLSNSPAINAGIGVGDTYTYGLNPRASWPPSVTTLNQISYGSGWEIGAFVYSGGDDNPPPYPPSGLRIISQ